MIYLGNENKIEIPESVNNIKGKAIIKSSATEIILPTNLETIDAYVFILLRNVKTINIPAKVKRHKCKCFWKYKCKNKNFRAKPNI